MRVFDPDTYPVEFTDEELATLQNCADTLNLICAEMKKHRCDTLEGGYDDDPVDFNIAHLIETAEYLHDFCSNVPKIMY